MGRALSPARPDARCAASRRTTRQAACARTASERNAWASCRSPRNGKKIWPGRSVRVSVETPSAAASADPCTKSPRTARATSAILKPVIGHARNCLGGLLPIVESDAPAVELLVILVPLSSDQNQISGTGHLHGPADRLPPVDDGLELGPSR